jgi:hypothetical protein
MATSSPETELSGCENEFMNGSCGGVVVVLMKVAIVSSMTVDFLFFSFLGLFEFFWVWMNKLMKITRRGGKKMKKWKKRLVVDGVLLDVVDIQNPIVTFLTKESMVKIKKIC